MAKIISFIENIEPKYTNVEVPIDMNILEYIYVASLEDILSNDDLVELILITGVYKTCLCDSYGLKELTIKYKDVEYILFGSPEGVPDNYDIFNRANANTKNGTVKVKMSKAAFLGRVAANDSAVALVA